MMPTTSTESKKLVAQRGSAVLFHFAKVWGKANLLVSKRHTIEEEARREK